MPDPNNPYLLVVGNISKHSGHWPLLRFLRLCLPLLALIPLSEETAGHEGNEKTGFFLNLNFDFSLLSFCYERISKITFDSTSPPCSSKSSKINKIIYLSKVFKMNIEHYYLRLEGTLHNFDHECGEISVHFLVLPFSFQDALTVG